MGLIRLFWMTVLEELLEKNLWKYFSFEMLKVFLELILKSWLGYETDPKSVDFLSLIFAGTIQKLRNYKNNKKSYIN